MSRSLSFRLCLLAFVVHIGRNGFSEAAAIARPADDTMQYETVHTSNAALLNRLGMSPLRIPQGHHKKRLAGPEPPLNIAFQGHQSFGRRHGHRDSHVYVVKLPPSLPYYAFTKPHKTSPTKDQSRPNAKGLVKSSSQNSPMGFSSNGKPGRIYHWNLPVMKKMAQKKKIAENQIRAEMLRKKTEPEKLTNDVGNNTAAVTHLVAGNESKKTFPRNPASGNDPNSNIDDASRLVPKYSRNNNKRLNYVAETSSTANDKRSSSSNKNYRLDDSPVYKVQPAQREQQQTPWNAVTAIRGNSPYGNANSLKQKKHRKKAATSYYAPINSRSGVSNSLHNNFPGNGRPKGFYVIEKSRKPVYYHHLLP